jgi:hypothetical protein
VGDRVEIVGRAGEERHALVMPIGERNPGERGGEQNGEADENGAKVREARKKAVTHQCARNARTFG